MFFSGSYVWFLVFFFLERKIDTMGWSNYSRTVLQGKVFVFFSLKLLVNHKIFFKSLEKKAFFFFRKTGENVQNWEGSKSHRRRKTTSSFSLFWSSFDSFSSEFKVIFSFSLLSYWNVTDRRRVVVTADVCF